MVWYFVLPERSDSRNLALSSTTPLECVYVRSSDSSAASFSRSFLVAASNRWSSSAFKASASRDAGAASGDETRVASAVRATAATRTRAMGVVRNGDLSVGMDAQVIASGAAATCAGPVLGL